MSLRNVKLALRSLVARPAYAAVAVLTIGVAVAANAAIFSAVHAVLLSPLPFDRPASLVNMDARSPEGYAISVSIPNYRDWRDRSRGLQTFGAAAGWGLALTGHTPAQVLSGQAVLGQFFETLGMRPLLGRLIPPDRTEPGAPSVVVLGYGAWQRLFGGDSTIVGQTLTLSERPYTVVGVLPSGSGYPSAETEVYIPMGSIPGLPWDDRTSSFGTEVIARLAPGTTLNEARNDLARVHRDVAEAVGEPVAEARVRSFTEYFLGDVRAQLWIVQGAVALVLLIAMANVANLQLARTEERWREMAVRRALGAGRGVLVRQLLTESLLLSGIGGAAGLVLASGAVQAVRPILPRGIPVAALERIHVDATVGLFTLILVTVCGVGFGLVPALRGSAVRLAEQVKAGARTTPARGRLRDALVVSEMALASVLLIGAGLMLQSMNRLRHADKGFVAEHLLTAQVSYPGTRYRDQAAWISINREIVTRAAAIPTVRHAALSLLVPLSHRSWELILFPDGVPVDRENGTSVLFNIVTPDYFRTLGVPLIAGRSFTEADNMNAPLVAVIDETMAHQFWPGQSAIGKRVTFERTAGATGDDDVPLYRTVVGVVKNLRHYTLARPSRIQVYVPYTQARRWGVSLSVLLRTAGQPLAVVPALQREVGALEPDAPVSRVRTLRSYVDDDLSQTRAMSTLLAGFGIVALVLAIIGVFGVMSYTVAQRTREIGIRMALGADARSVVVWVARRGLRLAAVGIVPGWLAAAGLTRLLRALLYQVHAIDPVTYGAIAALLLGVAGAAAYLPARRATRVSPVRALTDEG